MLNRLKLALPSCLPLLCVSLLCLGLSLGISGCSSSKDKEKTTTEKEVPVEKLYNDAAHDLDTGEYTKAAKGFDEVDRQYPYSPWATRAQLMSGYAYYKNLKYDEAVLALGRFIELHPGEQNVAYAYYLRALCYYEQISDVRRDQKMTQLALENLKQVVTRFPNSIYAKDATLKLDLTVDHLAGKEMEIGRYYLKHRQFQAAIPRFKRVIDNFQTTTHVPEALERLTESYLSLGLVDEAHKAAAILGHNYPQSSWYKATYSLLKNQGVLRNNGGNEFFVSPPAPPQPAPPVPAVAPPPVFGGTPLAPPAGIPASPAPDTTSGATSGAPGYAIPQGPLPPTKPPFATGKP